MSLRLTLLALLSVLAALTLGAGDAAPSEPQDPTPVVVSPNGAGPVQDPGVAPAAPAAGDPVPVEVDSAPSIPADEPEQPAEPPSSEPSDPPEPSEPPSDTSASEAPAVVAENQSSVWQVVWQVQQGCQSYCYGTQQSQNASQSAETTQDASAGADGESDSGNAVAINGSSTIQFVWQMQLGCVAFCYDTVQTQTASQSAQTTQTATSFADFAAAAVNMAETVQYVWQHQQGCQVECHNASASQSQSQTASTTQNASAVGGAGVPDGFLDSLVALAKNFGATVQFIFQHQLADCQSHCYGGSQAQDAEQRAEVRQTARAGDQPPAEPPPPVSEQSPGGDEQPIEAQPDGGDAASPAAAIVVGTDGTEATDDVGGGGPKSAPGFTRARDDRADQTRRSPSSASPPEANTVPSLAAKDTPAAAIPAEAPERPETTSRKRPSSSSDATTLASLPPAGPGQVQPHESADDSSIWNPVAGSLGALMLLTAIPVLRRSRRTPSGDN